MNVSPFIKPRFNTTQLVMLDVVIALLPLLVVGWIAFGTLLLQQVGVAITTALLTEVLFSFVLLQKKNTIWDGSALVTALLLVCTLSPATPLYIVSFGTFSALLFGKIVWGGLGKNRFNPALVGREFMAVFFVSTMTSADIWKTNPLVQTPAINLFSGIDNPYVADYLSSLFYKTNGAMGEYSIVCLVLGGLYLLLRNRISWHIPLALLGTFTLWLWIDGSADLRFSIAGILLATLFMATDMPSSPTNAKGKLYYGIMIGTVAYLFIKGDVRFEYMSYAILLLNGFADPISQVFQPSVWGRVKDRKQEVEAVFFLTLKILAGALAILSLYYYGWINYVVYLYIIYIIIKFNYSFVKQVNHVI